MTLVAGWILEMSQNSIEGNGLNLEPLFPSFSTFSSYFSVSSKNNNKSISKFSFLVNLLCHGCSFYNFTLVTKSQEMITTRVHELLATEQSNALPGLRAWSGLMLMMMMMMIQQERRRDWLYLIHMLLSSHTFADSRTQTLV